MPLHWLHCPDPLQKGQTLRSSAVLPPSLQGHHTTGIVIGRSMPGQELPRLMESASIEERKEFMQSLVERVVVKPEGGRLEVHMKKLPAATLPQPGIFSVGVVAGARSERVTEVMASQHQET